MAAAALLRRPARRAFTLIELLVSMTVTMLLVVALMQIFNAAASTWQHGEAQVDAYREARGALQLMARDLSATLQASYIPPRGAALTAVPPPLPTLALQHASDSYDAGGGPTNEEVYCLTNIPNSGAISGMGSLCAVGYYCQWLPDVSTDVNPPQAYALMRQALDSNGTFLRIQQAKQTPLSFDDLFGRMSGSTTQLAAYVWDLRFRIDTDLSEQNVPDGNQPSPADHTGNAFYRCGTGSYPTRLPPYVEIRFKALSDIAGRRLEGQRTSVTKATWKDDDASKLSAAYRSIILPAAQQFVLRVPLINATPLPTPTPTQ